MERLGAIAIGWSSDTSGGDHDGLHWTIAILGVLQVVAAHLEALKVEAGGPGAQLLRDRMLLEVFWLRGLVSWRTNDKGSEGEDDGETQELHVDGRGEGAWGGRVEFLGLYIMQPIYESCACLSFRQSARAT